MRYGLLLPLLIGCPRTVVQPVDDDDTAPVADTDTPADTQAPDDTGTPPPTSALVNEIMSDNTTILDDLGGYADWIELYNPTDAAIPLGGMGVSDDWTEPLLHRLDDSLVLEPGGFLVLWADGLADKGPLHLPFKLSNNGEGVGLFDADGEPLDWKIFPSLREDVAFGRLPDGGDDWTELLGGTPGAANQQLVRATRDLVVASDDWRYADTESVPEGWASADFDDSAWAEGPAPLGYGDSQATVISYGDNSASKHATAWFRRTVSVDAAVAGAALSLNLGLICDDGAIVYLNGTELHRRNMPAGDVTADTLASVTVSGTDESTFATTEAEADLLVAGDNVLAVEVHQASRSSSDMSFDLWLQAEVLAEKR